MTERKVIGVKRLSSGDVGGLPPVLVHGSCRNKIGTLGDLLAPMMAESRMTRKRSFFSLGRSGILLDTGDARETTRSPETPVGVPRSAREF